MGSNESVVSVPRASRPARTDGRRLRSERTRQLIIEGLTWRCRETTNRGSDKRAWAIPCDRCSSGSRQSCALPRPTTPLRRPLRRRAISTAIAPTDQIPGRDPRRNPRTRRGAVARDCQRRQGRGNKVWRPHQPRPTIERLRSCTGPSSTLPAGAQAHAGRARSDYRHRKLGAHARTARPQFLDRRLATSGSARSIAMRCRRRRRLLDGPAHRMWDAILRQPGRTEMRFAKRFWAEGPRIDGRRLRSVSGPSS